MPSVAVLSFDAALAELERTVAELEAGGLPLERTIALYERGVALDGRKQVVFEARLGDKRIRAGRQGRRLNAGRV